MESEPLATSSVLFDADGTQLPDPLPVLPDALTGPEHNSWAGDFPQTAPVALPPMPDGHAMREAIAAVFGEDPAAPGAGASGAGPPGPAGPGPYRPLVPVPYQPTGPARQRAQPPGRPRALAPAAVRADLRRRIGLNSAKQLQARASGGVRAGFVVALIILGVVVFYLVAEIVQLVAGLFS